MALSLDFLHVIYSGLVSMIYDIRLIYAFWYLSMYVTIRYGIFIIVEPCSWSIIIQYIYIQYILCSYPRMVLLITLMIIPHNQQVREFTLV